MQKIYKAAVVRELDGKEVQCLHIPRALNDEVELAIENCVDNLRVGDFINVDGVMNAVSKHRLLMRCGDGRVCRCDLTKGCLATYKYVSEAGFIAYVLAGKVSTLVYFVIE